MYLLRASSASAILIWAAGGIRVSRGFLLRGRPARSHDSCRARGLQHEDGFEPSSWFAHSVRQLPWPTTLRLGLRTDRDLARRYAPLMLETAYEDVFYYVTV
jgi:hypothetical protein